VRNYKPEAHICRIALFGLCVLGGAAWSERYVPPRPGSPETLTDWRWLARRLEGRRGVISDPWGKGKLQAEGDGFLIFVADCPGVVDHLWTTKGMAEITIEVDGRRLWRGTLLGAIERQQKGEDSGCPFALPLLFAQAGMYHLLAPIGFRKSLLITANTDEFPRHLSLRVFPEGTEVQAASAEPEGQYMGGLREAAAAWKRSGYGFTPEEPDAAQRLRQDFVLRAQERAVALECTGSGEIPRMAFHMNPALTGSLRNVVAEFFYDGLEKPSLRLPLPDLVGVPHPWPVSRWDAYNGDLAAGIRYPWYVFRPRYYYPEATFHFNLPIPFEEGLRIDLVNRSRDARFTGSVRALVCPLPAAQAREAGRLCAARTIGPVVPGPEPKPFLRVPGPGQLVGLGLFMTGNERAYPHGAVHRRIVSLTLDGGRPITGSGLLPLWFQGIYGGSVVGQPIWNHPRYEHQYAGVMRHFITDPMRFDEEAVFAFAPGAGAIGAPTRATTLAFWYRFADTPYEAAELSEQPEALPHSNFGRGNGHKGSRLFRFMEAEDLVPMAKASECSVRAVEDTEHDYHPSRGKYLHVVATQPGDYVDCAVPFPSSRYLSVGTLALWGPNRGDFEIDILSREQARHPPGFGQGDAFYRGRVLGYPPMEAPIFMGHSLRHRRDASFEFVRPILNPARDAEGILRFICQAKRQNSASFLMKLDRIRLDVPPRTKDGWNEFEEGAQPEMSDGASARLPKYGRFDWSGWGATILSSPPGGVAVFRAFLAVGRAKPTEFVIKGSLGPDQGTWQARCGERGESVTLSHGKDDKEIQEWRLPVTGAALPGQLALNFRCTAPGQREKARPRVRPAVLTLDAWTVR